MAILPHVYSHTSLYTGLSVKAQPDFRTGKFFEDNVPWDIWVAGWSDLA